jgi:hypothetical protein
MEIIVMGFADKVEKILQATVKGIESLPATAKKAFDDADAALKYYKGTEICATLDEAATEFARRPKLWVSTAVLSVLFAQGVGNRTETSVPGVLEGVGISAKNDVVAVVKGTGALPAFESVGNQIQNAVLLAGNEIAARMPQSEMELEKGLKQASAYVSRKVRAIEEGWKNPGKTAPAEPPVFVGPQ